MFLQLPLILYGKPHNFREYTIYNTIFFCYSRRQTAAKVTYTMTRTIV